ncbi:Odorant receptor 52 [Blattella germanica]|nr:Odorant receptor 52 [Blattella germanica]
MTSMKVHNSFNLVEKMMHISGLWEKQYDCILSARLYRCYTYIVKFFMIYFAIGIPMKIIYPESTEKAMEMVIMGIAHVILLFKLYLFYFRKKELEQVMSDVKKNFHIHGNRLTTENQKIIYETMLKARYICVTFAIMLYFSFFVYCDILPLVTIKNHEYTFNFESTGCLIHNITITYSEMRLPIDVWLPYSLKKTFVFQLTYTLLLIGCQVEAFNYISTDALFITLILYISGQFELLCDSLRSMPKNLEIRLAKIYTKVPECNDLRFDVLQREAEMYIRECAVHHQHLIRESRRVESLWRRVFFAQFLIESLWICLMRFRAMTMENRTDILMMILMLVCILMQMSLYCSFGSQLLTQSENVSNAVYSTDWYNQSENFKLTARMIIMRAQKPVRISAGLFGTISMPLLTKILRSSYSYLTLLLNLTEA